MGFSSGSSSTSTSSLSPEHADALLAMNNGESYKIVTICFDKDGNATSEESDIAFFAAFFNKGISDCGQNCFRSLAIDDTQIYQTTLVASYNNRNYGFNITIADPELLGISAVESASERPVATYSLSGARIPAQQRGVQILKTSDGRAFKVFR